MRNKRKRRLEREERILESVKGDLLAAEQRKQINNGQLGLKQKLCKTGWDTLGKKNKTEEHIQEENKKCQQSRVIKSNAQQNERKYWHAQVMEGHKTELGFRWHSQEKVEVEGTMIYLHYILFIVADCIQICKYNIEK